jgi:hypothetical protein
MAELQQRMMPDAGQRRRTGGSPHTDSGQTG